ncbi:MAG: T9SS type A sorting domain-containing protein [Bacteroidota bacterium]|nr:T9SS type A sorting domain-containing protein [Bacteroidota bacterium]
MKVINKLVLVMGLCLLFMAVAWAQTTQSLQINATDGIYSDYIIIGIHPDATMHIDSTDPPGIGEYELPPPTPGFDVRCVSFDPWDELGLGAKKNYHKMVFPSQTDQYMIRFTNDEGASAVTFSWQAGLGSLYGGYWKLFEADGVTELCDMTIQTSYQYHTPDNLPQYIILKKGDAKGFATATVDSIAASADEKGKSGKAVNPKRKAWGSQGCYTFTNTTGGDVNDLYIEFSAAVIPTKLSFGPFTIAENLDAGKNKKWTFKGATIGDGNSVTVCAWGTAGKELVAKKWYWTLNGTIVGTAQPAKIPDVGTGKLRLPMPNWLNVLEELYTAKYAAKGQIGIVAGVTYSVGKHPTSLKDMYKYIYNPKAKDAYKTLYDKLLKHTTTPTPPCLDKDAKGNHVVKPFKTYPPSKYQNKVAAELLTLGFNIEMSDAGHTSTGFGDLRFKKRPSDPTWVDGLPICSLRAIGNRFISCAPLPADPAATAADLTMLLQRANSSFNGVRDTQTFAPKTVLKPVKLLVDITDLYRPTLSSPEPTVGPDFVYINNTPVTFELRQNYPNPFNPTTTIEFDLSEDAFVSLKIYNMLGQEVETIADRQEFYEGVNEIEFDASHLASGIYYYRLVVNDGQFQQVKKMILLR